MMRLGMAVVKSARLGAEGMVRHLKSLLQSQRSVKTLSKASGNILVLLAQGTMSQHPSPISILSGIIDTWS